MDFVSILVVVVVAVVHGIKDISTVLIGTSTFVCCCIASHNILCTSFIAGVESWILCIQSSSGGSFITSIAINRSTKLRIALGTGLRYIGLDDDISVRPSFVLVVVDVLDNDVVRIMAGLCRILQKHARVFFLLQQTSNFSPNFKLSFT